MGTTSYSTYAIYLVILTIVIVALSIKFTGKPKESEWYQGLKKPPGMAPEWVFGVAWSILYPLILIGILIAVWYITTTSRSNLTLVYTGLVALTLLWVLAFFYFQYINVGALIMLLLIGLTSYIIYLVWPPNLLSKTDPPNHVTFVKCIPVIAFFGLLAWITVATYFNIGISLLNPS